MLVSEIVGKDSGDCVSAVTVVCSEGMCVENFAGVKLSLRAPPLAVGEKQMPPILVGILTRPSCAADSVQYDVFPRALTSLSRLNSSRTDLGIFLHLLKWHRFQEVTSLYISPVDLG